VVYPADVPSVSGGCGSHVVSYSPAANALVLGHNPVTATVTDISGATATCVFDVLITDTTPPVITLTGSSSVNVECHGGYIDAGATASDICDGNITSKIVTVNPVDANTPGTYTVTYDVSDASGNPATEVTRTVIVADTQAPQAPTLPTLTSQCSGPVIVPVPTAFDACLNRFVQGTTSDPLVYSTAGTNIVHWSFSDGHNMSTASQTVIVSTLLFVGFDSPIGGTGGTCDKPLRTVNPGSNLAIKFTTTCNGTVVFVGQPKVFVYQYPTCNSSPVPIVVDQDFHIVANEWHFNLDTSHLSTGVYQIIATQADGTTVLGTAFIKLK
jgi:hypothetical protein